ncbi:RHS repeat domain-containing protein [Flavobacterium columnare]|uniref:RHS repeat domain-containing protein n=1 Tax=Flavobacterium columnare TaxID=996 RepID=UPI00403482B1
MVQSYLWDGNVLLHQWTYQKGQEAQSSVNDLGEVYLSQKETVEDLITWIYQENSFVPCAKIQAEEQFSIISDYLGRPVQSYDQQGRLVWQTDYDIYGKLRNFNSHIGLTPDFIPFRQLGQYQDPELDGLYYNRFRYYDCETGLYVSQDPIGLAGNNPTLYAYVHDSNKLVDIFGLAPWGTGGFGSWFDNASVQDVIKNKEAVSNALRGSGGMHEKFPVSMASKAKELGFTHSELMNMTVDRSSVWFENVPDKYGNIHNGPHSTGAKLPDGQSGKASSWFHKNLMEDLDGAKTKQEALDIIDKHHNAHMKCK